MCTQNQLNSILQKFEQEAKAIFGDRLVSIVLFGSYARGDFDEESDIDILILADMSSEELSSYRGRIDTLCGDLLWEYGIVVSAIEKDVETYSKYSNILPFYKNIEQEGVKIA
ncbi:MAG: nucleotidyltransferase domain-containing protein [Clostridia bacterium]|nr:nucleotidyltransferase domain-containing protein [Clostridia bacterium]